MRRIVIGVMFVLLLSQVAWYAGIPALAAHLVRPRSLLLTLVLALLMIAALAVSRERWSRLVMAALVARYVVVYLL